MLEIFKTGEIGRRGDHVRSFVYFKNIFQVELIDRLDAREIPEVHEACHSLTHSLTALLITELHSQQNRRRFLGS